MPLTIELTDHEVIKDPTVALFKCNTLVHAHRAQLQTAAKGKRLSAGDFRGVVTSLDGAHVSLKNEEGVEKSIALTSGRLSQLICGETSRK